MGNLQRRPLLRESKNLNHDAANEQVRVTREKDFLRKYDEVLNKYILSVFRKTVEELNRSHDHRAVKIIGGEVVHMRLDSLHGQADGIKILSENEQIGMYMWFGPDLLAEKIIFKMVYGGKERRERYALEAIGKEFLMDLIAKKFELVKKTQLN